MSDTCDRSAGERFCPELRGWAALRLVALVPPEVRSEIERPTPAGERESFSAAALAVVSTTAAIAWSRRMADCLPAAGPAAGPACIARLWIARLLSPGGGIEAYWPSVVDLVWNVIRPSVEKLGLSTLGARGGDLRHEIAAPLALVFLKSLAAGRKDLRLLGMGGLDRPDGPPFGWAPGIDSLTPLIRYLAAGQVPGTFRSHAFMRSPLARLLRDAGLAVPITVACWRCRSCGARGEDGQWCRQCGGPVAPCRARRLVPRATLEYCGSPARGGGRLGDIFARAAAAGPAVHERVEAADAGRECVRRARLLWAKVTRSPRPNVSALAVLGILAGVDPAAAVADPRQPEGEWLQRLVESLTEGRLDRESLARRAAAALPAVAAYLGRPPPAAILPSYVGVIATRFRQAILGRPAGVCSGRRV